MSEALVQKLKLLSLASMATGRKALAFSEVQAALDLPDLKAAERMLTQAIFVGILRGKLSQRDNSFEVTSALGRDVELEAVGVLASQVDAWSSSVKQVLQAIHERMAEIETAKVMGQEREHAFQQAFAEARTREGHSSAKGREKGGADMRAAAFLAGAGHEQGEDEIGMLLEQGWAGGAAGAGKSLRKERRAAGGGGARGRDADAEGKIMGE